MCSRRPVLLLLLLVMVPVPLSLDGGRAPTAAAGPAPVVAGIRVAVGNVREGSLLRYPADSADGTDRRRFAARLLGRGAAPDVVLLQEVLGSAAKLARVLTAHPRAREQQARYVVATSTGTSLVRGKCDGTRAGRFRLLRSSAVLINRRTVTAVHARGAVRTWGRWHRRAWSQTGRQGYGCTAHPWVHATVRGRPAVLSSVHLAPAGHALKSRALQVVASALDRRTHRPDGPVAVLGGDLNLSRCRHPARFAETRDCPVRPAHRRLLDAGFVDVVRSAHTAGPRGVVGVSRRVDFLYARATAEAARWDRCNRVYLVRRWTCSAHAAEFATAPTFAVCQRRSLHHGRPGAGCSARQYRRYYSDHPILTSTVGARL